MGRIKKSELYKMIGVTPDTLISEIESIVYRKRLNYIDTTVYFCEINDLDIESVCKIIPS